jgi:3'(2'), 5'-bisphosphate nucleotidase
LLLWQAKKFLMFIISADFGVETKSDSSPLTIADKLSNEVIVNALKTEFPDIPIISEEEKGVPYETRKNWNKFWLIDPLDGTKEFIKKNGEFTVNIALIDNHYPVAGVVYSPVLGKMYYAWEGKILARGERKCPQT